MTDSQSWKFILDASALIEMLGAKRPNDPPTGRRRMQPGKLTQLARNQLIWVTPAVAEEVLTRSDVIAEWVRDNRKLTQPTDPLDAALRYRSVSERTNHLPSVQNSAADMEGLCSAVAFNDEALGNQKVAIVVRDDQYEAACFAMGVTALSPSAFVLTFANQPLP